MRGGAIWPGGVSGRDSLGGALSSTFTDLETARAAVTKTLRRAGHEVVEMEEYIAADERPLDKCLAGVASCDVYVGIIAWRYGYVPPGQANSITELEFREARRLAPPCCFTPSA